MDANKAIIEAAEKTNSDLLPDKSRDRYEQQYKHFESWCNEKKVKSLKEEVFLAYFADLSKKAAVFTNEDISKFMLTVPDETYLMIKVATIFGLAGACRRAELSQITIDNIEDKGILVVVKITDSKNHSARSFVISAEVNNGKFLELYRKYANLRPSSVTSHRRFFIKYTKGKCSVQCIGINTIGKIPSEIAAYLGLPNPERYTGHSFRRSSATFLADSGEEITNIKRLGGWKSTSVAESYIEESEKQRENLSNKILTNPSTSFNLQPINRYRILSVQQKTSCVLDIAATSIILRPLFNKPFLKSIFATYFLELKYEAMETLKYLFYGKHRPMISEYLNSLEMNAALLFCGNKVRGNLSLNLNLSIDNVRIPFKDSAKNLGLVIDNKLRFRDHVTSILRKGYSVIKMIYSHRDSLNRDMKKTLCESLVLSIANYCDNVYGPCLDDVDKRRLQKLQNSCLRLIFGVRRRHRISHSLLLIYIERLSIEQMSTI
ncbi:hypothetical protein NQ315_012802 [Exocentrus adspersus]|uniref:Tyr recombinase domain-containing protein n=1 Tax=Exocentrus adspersus TaxID=1586481 RepID=A0AAV8VBE7_9CUCU|nr:hypothetical protein NQ315_012802 [Exocentrus adspersus]